MTPPSEIFYDPPLAPKSLLTYGDNIPKSTSKKADYVEFLQTRGITFNPKWTAPQLWQMVKGELEGDAPCLVDDVASKKGVKIIRLPPYHPELNPIEQVWAYIKAKVSAPHACC